MTVVTIHQPCCCEQLGTQLDADAIYRNTNSMGMSVIQMHKALLERQEEVAQRALVEIIKLSTANSVLAAHLERKIAAHRRRGTGVRS